MTISRHWWIGASLLICATAAGAMPVIRLRANAAAIAPDQARMLPATALAEAMLAPGHPPVDEASVGSEGMEAPVSPGSPITTRIKFYFTPTRGPRPDFCERVIATLYLAPADRLADGTVGASRPGQLSTETAYRRLDRAQCCAGRRYQFFLPPPDQAAQAIDLVGLLAKASRDARSHRTLGYPISVDDRLGPEMMGFERAHPSNTPTLGLRVYTDARMALAALPLDAVSFAGPAANAVQAVLTDRDRVAADGHAVDTRIVFADVWTIGVVLDHGRIVRISMRREMPAPF